MIQGQFRIGKLTAWLVPVVLVLNLFAFSGSVSRSAAKQSEIKTEQIDPLRISNKRSASFQYISIKSALWNDGFAISLQQIASHHTRTIKTQVLQSTRHSLEFIGFSPAILQYSPRSPDEDFSISKIG